MAGVYSNNRANLAGAWAEPRNISLTLFPFLNHIVRDHYMRECVQTFLKEAALLFRFKLKPPRILIFGVQPYLNPTKINIIEILEVSCYVPPTPQELLCHFIQPINPKQHNWL